MARFRSRPTEIHAVQWTGENAMEVESFNIAHGGGLTIAGDEVDMFTAHGDRAIARPHDWIVVETELGRYYPVKPEVFTARWAPDDGEREDEATAPATEPASHILTGWRAGVAGGEQTVHVDLRDRDAALTAAQTTTDPIPPFASLDLLHAEALRDELTNTLATAKAVAGLAPLAAAGGGNAQSFAEELTRKVESRSVAEALGALAGFGGRRGGLFG